ncbi:MAG TPA: cytochrome d ubiquinol oxidase subunit II [Candidatus Gallibacteroides avistercoris]|uniref:Cytochrome d ubiquinol oxidase subunit II n=1 Tax=Candidatus Gallibacteroides avistercoris TaxID=2840833 RepID=A0A9D1M8Q2_9BACT|nr:cytochrome d ubiquinol oxidase subunit II [Candidatus Gallibacteroides avistercoris]
MELTYEFFQQYWWFIISLLGALLVFLLFVQGGQTLLNVVAKNDAEETLLINSLGRKWEFTFTTLVVFGGAFFASFPLFYSTSFGGAYWLWMAILFSFIIQAVSYEYRSKPGNFLGKKTYDTFLKINGLAATVLLGVAVGTFFSGSDFVVNKNNITDVGMPVISTWQNPLHGLEAILNLQNLSLGLAVFFLARIQGALYFINNIDNDNIYLRSKRQVLINAIPFVVFFLLFLAFILWGEGYELNRDTGKISLVQYKYFFNLVQMYWVGVLLLIGVVLVLYAILRTVMQNTFRSGIWFSGIGTILVVLSLFFVAGYNHTAYYPSVADMQSSLTIYNSSSSLFTLKVMSVVSILVPVVLAYIAYTWRIMDRHSITEEEMQHESEKY